MASPFSVFRRNQKVLLAVAGITAMVAFVFLDPVMRYMGGRNQPVNPVVVETSYGNVKQSELDGIRQTRELVNVFLRQVSVETVTALGKKGLRDPRNFEQEAEQWYEFWRQQLMIRSENGPEKAALETYLLSKKAEQLGIVVTDVAINELLKQITAQALTEDTLKAIIKGLIPGRPVSTARLYDAIRTEVLAARFSELFITSLRDIPPAQRFEYYSRLNRRAKAEVIPLAVADFIAQVPDPGTEELQAFFDAHKNRLPDPTSPDPGFKEPKRAAFQYFKAEFAKFTDQYKPQVTDAEIAAYYEENKSQFRAIELPAETPDAANPDAPSDSGEKPSDQKPEDGDNSTAPESAVDKPTDDKPGAEKPATEAAEEKKPDVEKPDGDKPEGDKPADSKSSQSARGRSAIRLVSTAGDDADPSAKPAAADETKPAPEAKPAADAQPADDAQPGAGDDQPKADQPAGDQPAAEEKKDPATENESAAGKDAADKPDEKVAEPKYEPLEKVREKIRDSLAAQKANKHLSEMFDKLSGEMRRYADEIDVFKSRKGSNPGAAPPKPFPFAELAKAEGIEAKELPLVSAAEATKEDIGHVNRVIRDRRSQFGFRVEPFADFAFSDSYLTYQPMAGQDSEGNVYLFWKNDEKASYVPTLDEARKKVVRAWKMIKARALATKRAEEYVTQGRAAAKPLAEFFGSQTNLKVVTTDWFSWLTIGNVPFDPAAAQPRISAIEGLDNIGESFMEAVFKLPAGGLGTAMNHPQDTAYVIRLAEYERPLDELRQDFAGERQPRYMVVGQPEQRRMYLAWLADLNKAAHVHWVRDADTAIHASRAQNEPEEMPEADF